MNRPGQVGEATRDIRQARGGHPVSDTESTGGNEVVSELLEAAGEGGDGGHEPGMELSLIHISEPTRPY